MTNPESLHLFCRVVDNFGDIGVCWRLARQLAHEHAIEVTLWVDDLASFRKICAAIDPGRDAQRLQDVSIRRWTERFGPVAPSETADIVIEAFACEPPAEYLAAMAKRESKPVWINLEYLSAEPWVEGCHAMASHHPSLPLTKHFYFPGFSDKTGGLPAERGLAAARAAFQGNPAEVARFFAELGVDVPPGARILSLFCYPHAPAAELYDALRVEAQPTLCLVPEGVAPEASAAFLRQAPHPGARATHGSLTLQVLPFVDQPEYDKLLWACDLNFVRGEDSFVRAQWAARPFVWHIYPQDERAHWDKLDAFLNRYEHVMSAEAARALSDFWHAWNGDGDIATHWHSFQAVVPQLSRYATDWADALAKNGDLASNLIQFARQFG